MKHLPAVCAGLLCLSLILLPIGCGTVPIKKFYTLNYIPEPLKERLSPAPYPCTIRVREFDIEKAYDLRQIIYRTSAYELGRYFYRVWAVDPPEMIADLIQKHFASVNIVSHVVRRFDEGGKPDYELSGHIEAIEQYESDDIWFAHLAFRLTLTRVADNRVVYNRHFDNRKQVHVHDPVQVVQELSRIMDVQISQAIHDIDAILSREYGRAEPTIQTPVEPPPFEDEVPGG